MSTIRTILHPTDFSDNSGYAFQTACSMAKDYGARLLLLHVMSPTVVPALSAPPPDPLEPAESQKYLTIAFPWPKPTDPNIRVEHRVAEGDPPDEILQLARTEDCDLVVMGTHGRTGLGRLLTGSVAEEVLRKATCPVLVVKTPRPGAEPVRSEPLAKPGEIVSVRPFGTALSLAHTATLARSNGLEITRLIVPPEEELTERKARGTTVLQCVDGRVALTAVGKMQFVEAGELVYVPAGEGYTVKGVEGASLLRTMMLPKG
jgi:nucleotide-binding universal stress UspA family protein/quercetin dioxygenase-like cupin family protein